MASLLMRPGEIYLAKFPFGDVPGMKLRPVLLLTEPVGAAPEVVTAYISSVIPSRLLPSDLLPDPAGAEFRATNLKTASAPRLHKLATVHRSSLARYLGVVGSEAQRLVASKLRDLLQL
jgi:PemK-like, MazF-like toxin of type II toxin-antitoxin system